MSRHSVAIGLAIEGAALVFALSLCRAASRAGHPICDVCGAVLVDGGYRKLLCPVAAEAARQRWSTKRDAALEGRA